MEKKFLTSFSKIFWDQNPPKMGRCHSNWIIILFFIHLNGFGVEKVEESTHRTIFTSGTQFRKTRFETFQECFEASNDVFWGKNLSLKNRTFSCYSTHRYISNGARLTSIEVRMQKLCHSKVDLPVSTPIVCEDATLASLFMENGLAMCF